VLIPFAIKHYDRHILARSLTSKREKQIHWKMAPLTYCGFFSTSSAGEVHCQYRNRTPRTSETLNASRNTLLTFLDAILALRLHMLVFRMSPFERGPDVGKQRLQAAVVLRGVGCFNRVM
jgi:hypothetical protein